MFLICTLKNKWKIVLIYYSIWIIVLSKIVIVIGRVFLKTITFPKSLEGLK